MNQAILLVGVLCGASLIKVGTGHTGIAGPSPAYAFAFSLRAAVQSQSSSAEKASSLPNGTNLQVELTKSLDAKNAKPGEEVTARLMQDVKSNGNVVLPKGSKVIGHVAEAQPRDKQHTESRLALVFDKAVAKGGQEMKLTTALAAVALPVQSPPSAASNDNLSVPQSMGSSSNQMGGTSSGGAARSAGGGSLPGTMDSSASGVIQADADKSPAGNANATQGSSSKAVPGSQGLSLTQEASGMGVMTSTSHTVKLESGTQLLLRVLAGGR